MSLTDIWEFLRAEWREEWAPAFRAERANIVGMFLANFVWYGLHKHESRRSVLIRSLLRLDREIAAYVRGRKAGRRVAAADINLGDVLLARSDGHRRTTAPRRSRYAATYRGRSE
jgi:hypothetical protein